MTESHSSKGIVNDEVGRYGVLSGRGVGKILLDTLIRS